MFTYFINRQDVPSAALPLGGEVMGSGAREFHDRPGDIHQDRLSRTICVQSKDVLSGWEPRVQPNDHGQVCWFPSSP
jgi:hypothetical protein